MKGPWITGVGARRELAYAVFTCLAGAGLVLFASGRTWLVEQGATEPLSTLTQRRTGGDVAPALPGLGLVGLAGAGALLATRRAARAVVGAVISICGALVIASAGKAIADGVPPGWPAATAAAGVVLVAGGVLALVRGRRWPALGARYERRDPADTARDTGAGPVGATGQTSADAWAALDRGEDPTAD